MKALKIIALTIVFILFLLAGTSFLLAKSADKTFLNPEYYENLMDKTDVVSIVTRQVSRGIESGKQAEMPQEEKIKMQKIINNSISEEWAEKELQKSIADFLAYLKGEQENLTAVINLESRKELIRSNIENKFKEQMEERSVPSADFSSSPQAQAQKDRELDKIMSQVPNKIALVDLIEQSPNTQQFKESVAKFQNIYSYFNIVSYSALALLALLMIVLAGIASGLKWTGAGMLASGVLAIVISFVLDILLPLIMANLDPNLKASNFQLFIKSFTSKIYTLSLIYSAIGLIALVAGIVVSKTVKKGNREPKEV